jgi:hypothetical protein
MARKTGVWVRVRMVKGVRISSNMWEAFILTSITLWPLPHCVGRMSKILTIHAHRTVYMRHIYWSRSALALGHIVGKISVRIRMRVWTSTVVIRRGASHLRLVIWVWVRVSVISRMRIKWHMVRHMVRIVRIILWNMLRHVLRRVVASWRMGKALHNAHWRAVISRMIIKWISRRLMTLQIGLLQIHLHHGKLILS